MLGLVCPTMHRLYDSGFAATCVRLSSNRPKARSSFVQRFMCPHLRTLRNCRKGTGPFAHNHPWVDVAISSSTNTTKADLDAVWGGGTK